MLGNPPTLVTTMELARRAIIEEVPGDFVECGVFAGSHPAVMARELMWSNEQRLVHLFDSFQGIPHAGPKDDETITGCIGAHLPMDGRLVSSGVSACTQEQVAGHMREWGIDPAYLRYHVGWFQNTVPMAAKSIKQIALLRLDGDLYDSTAVCLEHLYPRVSRGGFIIIDDYALTGCRRAVADYFNRPENRMTQFSTSLVQIKGGDGPAWFVKP